jgi:SPP1 family predicted phage head-tail adaptor
MRAGQLRHSIIIQQVTETPDTAGNLQESWATFATMRAAVVPLRGEELLRGQQIHGEVNYKITIRYKSGIVPKMRVSWGSRTFHIHAVANIHERDRTIELMCSEDV